MPPLRLSARKHAWRLKEPFAISRGSRTQAEVVIVELDDGSVIGRGEASGVAYHGETPASLLAQIEQVRDAVEAGSSREELPDLLPAGGARHALDAALWDLEARRSGQPVWKLAGVPHWRPVDSAVTIGIRSAEACAIAAAGYAQYPWIKLKVGNDAPLEAVAAVRRAAPGPRLIVDANQAWSVDDLRRYAPELAALRVDLLEQPVPAGADAELAQFRCPVPLCADEAFSTLDDLPGLAERYQFVNIKLDKCGGLSTGLRLAAAAQAAGLRLMVGCMLGGSIAVAPAMVLAQLCEVADLDGPWLQAEDWPSGIVYDHGRMRMPEPRLWG